MNSPTRKWCHKLADVPPGDHFAILEFSSVYIPGDERSQQYPGHGYPGGNEPIVVYIAYTDEQEWKRDVIEHTTSKTSSSSFVAVRIKRAHISVNVEVDVN